MTMDRIDILTQSLNSAFVNAYEMSQEPYPIESAMTIVPSKGRVENYPWMYPPPMMHKWKGYREFAKAGEANYRVPNVTYDNGFEIELEDWDDAQVDGWKRMSAAMADGAKQWKIIQSMVNLANGQTVSCYDGGNFFATTRVLGAGNNIITGAAASTDGVTHAFVVLYTGNGMVKPLMWQNREEADFQTDAGSLESNKHRVIQNWTTLRGAAAFGFPFDAILVKLSNTPTVQELQTALGTVKARFRTFTYPKNLPSDVAQYYHHATTFSDKNLMIVCSSGLEHLLQQCLTLSLIASTENIYRGMAQLVTSGYLDAVV